MIFVRVRGTGRAGMRKLVHDDFADGRLSAVNAPTSRGIGIYSYRSR